ncbi:MAG: GNAT family N-acetyltransferase [Candidatus Thorarchaeota archaeon]
MTSVWEFSSTDGRQIRIEYAHLNDARAMHKSFCEVVDEGLWLPTFSPNSTVADWIDWVQRSYKNREVLLVAKIENEYAGHLTLQPEEWVASRHVARLGIIVHRDLRNMRVGRSLMFAAEEAGVAKKYEKIVLSTFSNNGLALALYESLGYHEIGRRKKHFKMPSNYIDEVLMEKMLIE